MDNPFVCNIIDKYEFKNIIFDSTWNLLIDIQNRKIVFTWWKNIFFKYKVFTWQKYSAKFV